MAKVKKAATKKANATARKLPKRGVVEVTLPSAPTELSSDIRDFSILVHGEKKIGKTSLFAQEDGAFFLEFDPEQRAYAILQRHVPDWAHYLAYLKALETEAKRGKLKYRTLVVDGVDLMYQAAFKHMCKKLAIVHPNDENDFGKSWGAIKTEFSAGIHRILNIPGTATRFICHSAWREIKTRSSADGKIEKLVPILTGQAEEVLVGLVDVWAAYCYDGKDRVLVVKGDETTGAGHRVDHCFRTPKGEAISEIYMGRGPKEAYGNLVAAFSNKQTYVDMEARTTAKPKRRKPKVRG